jgi:formylglycine-generating enzyme required for sulfatase activity/uncharacterized protein YraI
MRKIIIFVFYIFTLASNAIASSIVEITTRALNVRSGPGINFDKIGEVRRGQALPYLNGLKNGWVEIQLQNGKTGWVSCGFARVLTVAEDWAGGIVDAPGFRANVPHIAPSTGKVEISSTPSGALIRINCRAATGHRTPSSLTLPIGEAYIEASKYGYKPVSMTVDVRSDRATQISMVLDKAGKVIQDPLSDGTNGPEMVVVEPGCFEMGSDKRNENPIHLVCFKAPFAISKYEVTQRLWTKVMGSNPSHFKCEDCPVEQVSWNDIQGFIKKLNQQSSVQYRLPTEAEWEYACRSGGKDEIFCGRDDPRELGWSRGVGSGRITTTQQVGTKQANGLGLYDMSGNVWEWVADCWHNSYTGAPTNGSAWYSGECSRRVQRGGSWHSRGVYMKSASRISRPTDERNIDIGFRLAR